MRQKTLKEPISFSGRGIHSNLDANVRLLPAPANTGIVFRRTDLPIPVDIKAEPCNVVNTNHATTLGRNGVSVSTVEHLLASFYGMGVDNAIVEIDNSEVPIMDGSADCFVKLILQAGRLALGEPRLFIFIKRPIKVVSNNKMAMFVPAKEFRISYTIDFSHPVLDEQLFSSFFSEDTFREEISRARTFGFLDDIETLKANGLAKGGSLNNAIVIGDDNVLNDEGMRYPDEPVRHKVLDIMGDLSLIGMPVIGHLIADRSGHKLNNKLVTKILSSPIKWRIQKHPVTHKSRRSYTRQLCPAY